MCLPNVSIASAANGLKSLLNKWGVISQIVRGGLLPSMRGAHGAQKCDLAQPNGQAGSVVRRVSSNA